MKRRQPLSRPRRAPQWLRPMASPIGQRTRCLRRRLDWSGCGHL